MELIAELDFGGGSTCHRRKDESQRAGVWERLHEQLLAELRAAGEIEWSRAPASAATAGSSSAPSPGSTSSNDCSSATTAAPRSTKPSSPRLLPRLLCARGARIISNCSRTRPSRFLTPWASGSPITLRERIRKPSLLGARR